MKIDDHHIAQGAMLANNLLQQQLGPIAQMFAAAQKVIQAKMPQPQIPPDVQASLQIAQAETARKAQADQAAQALREKEFQAEQAAVQRQEAIAQAQSRLDAQLKKLLNAQDNQQHQMTELLKNQDDNRTALRIHMNELQAKQDKSFEVFKELLDSAVRVEVSKIAAKTPPDASQAAAETAASSTVAKDLSQGA